MPILKSKQFSSVIEWDGTGDGVLFHKFDNVELKKGSRLIVRPGQEAIFLYNGAIEGVFTKEGDYDIESDIIPFLSTLKGIKFGFDSGRRVEVVFVNVKQMSVNWGTRQPVYLADESLPGGVPVRLNGNFVVQVADYNNMMKAIVGVTDSDYTIEDIKGRVMPKISALVMKHTSQAKNYMYLQTNNDEVSRAICADLDEDLKTIGFSVCDFTIGQISYPEEVARMAEKVAGQSMIGGNMATYQQAAMADALTSGNGDAGSAAGSMAGMAAGFAMGQNMVNNMMGNVQGANGTGANATGANVNAAGANANPAGASVNPAGAVPGGAKFCPNCGTGVEGMKFCPNCGQKLM